MPLNFDYTYALLQGFLSNGKLWFLVLVNKASVNCQCRIIG